MSGLRRRLSHSGVAAAYRRYRWSVSARAVTTIGVVLGGYVLLHAHFARFDAFLARNVLDALGFQVSSYGRSGLVVSDGREFDVTAIVTGSCSSAAGVLGLGAVTVFLLHGGTLRRLLGGLGGALLFVAFNQVRICSILLVGWWLATAPRAIVLTSLLVPAVVALPLVLLPHRRLLLRIGAFLVASVAGVLAYDVWAGHPYLGGMISYHALAGPMLTFATLALGILLLWRAIAGPDRLRVPARAAA